MGSFSLVWRWWFGWGGWLGLLWVGGKTTKAAGLVNPAASEEVI